MQWARSITGSGIALCVLLLAITFSSCVSSPEAKSTRFIDAGKKLMEKKDASRAILQFQNAVKVTPRNAEAYYQLGAAFLAAGDVGHGVTSLRKSLELAPKQRDAQLLMARLMTVVDDKTILQEAEQRLRTYLQDSPDDADALHSLALTEFKLGAPEEAIRDLTHAMAAAPQQVVIAATLAQAKLQRGDVKGAEEVLKKAHENAPNSIDALILLGRFYETQKKMADAEQQFRQALAINANDSSALFNLGSLQLGAGRLQEAEQTFRVASKLPNKVTQHALGTFLYQQGRKEEAVKEFERLAKDDPDDRMARTRLVTAYQLAGRKDDAEKVLADALKKNPKDADALLERGELSLAGKKLNDAEADLNQVLHLRPDSAPVHYALGKLYDARGEPGRYRQELSKALELNPLMSPVRLELAQALINAKEAQAALDLLNAPNSPKDSLAFLAARNWALWAKGDMAELRKGIDQGLYRERSTEFLLQDGMWKLRSGNVAGARSSLEESLKVNPQDVRALEALQRSYEMQKQTAVAVEKVKEYAAKAPNSAPVQDFLGSLLLARGDHAGARTAFEAAKAVDTHSVTTDLSLVQVNLVEGKLDNAQQQLQTILSANPSNATAHLWLGNVELTKGNYKTALEQFRAVVAAEPENTQALNNLAYLLTEYVNQPAEALKYAQKAKELAPETAEYSDTLGWVFYHQGLYPSAVRELERAAAKTNDVTLKYHLAMAYAKAGDWKRGHATLESALRENSNLPEAKSAQQVVNAAAPSGANAH